MAKFYRVFGEDPVDLLVAAFLKAKGIDPKDITGYRLSRGVDQFGTISIDMPFASAPPEPQIEVTSVDQAVREYLPLDEEQKG